MFVLFLLAISYTILASLADDLISLLADELLYEDPLVILFFCA